MAHTRPGKRRGGPPGLPGGSICPFESSLGVAWQTVYQKFSHSTTLTRGVGRGVPFRVRPPPHQTVRAVFPHTASRVKLSLPIPLATQHQKPQPLNFGSSFAFLDSPSCLRASFTKRGRPRLAAICAASSSV